VENRSVVGVMRIKIRNGRLKPASAYGRRS
jgi:hypothetical protein